MPKMIPVNTIVLHRDGKSFTPPIGKAFEFTKDELAEIEKVLPGAVREPVQEVAVVNDPVQSPEGEKTEDKTKAQKGKANTKEDL